MLAVLLCAGRSKRFWPIDDKNFLFFLGKTLVEHQIELLQKTGLKEIVIVCGEHNLRQLKGLAAKFKNVHCVEQKDLEAGLAGAVLTAREAVLKRPFMLLSSNDVIEEKALKMMLERAKKSDAASLLLGKKVSTYFPGGYIEIGRKNQLKRIVEKPGAGNQPSDLVNLLIHVHKNPGLLFTLLEKQNHAVEGRYEEVFNTLLRMKEKVEVVQYDGFWQGLKYPWHVFEVMRHLFKSSKKKISKKAMIAKTAVIKGDVIIEDGVKIFDFAVISGPCYLGKNVVVANHALVRDSQVGEGSVIGFSTEIARSYLGRNVWTHSNYIGDSVISDNCSFGSGTVTGNLRLDELEIASEIQGEMIGSCLNKFGLVSGKNVRAGINISFMPGVKVGEGAFVGAGIVVPKDVPDNSFVTGNWDLKIRENKAAVNQKTRAEMKMSLRGPELVE